MISAICAEAAANPRMDPADIQESPFAHDEADDPGRRRALRDADADFFAAPVDGLRGDTGPSRSPNEVSKKRKSLSPDKQPD